MLKIISRNSDRLSDLTDDLLDQQRLESGQLTLSKMKGNLNMVIREIIEKLEIKFRNKNQDLKINLSEVSETIFDHTRNSQVLINLLSNANKFSPENTEIRISSWSGDDSIYVSVEDEEFGIEPDEVDNIFKPFGDSERTAYYKGTGLRLSISKGIIDLHNGNIWVESEGEGKGAVFIFTIPISND